ncbi:MAG: tRNA pseudouridine(55) synthase TruB [Xanthomonadales bacterium]|nr:tRNA pseudouridine(55) synthase TruB [Xanthomonadales bacterium]
MSRPRRAPTRKIDGIILLDKPQGLSSNQALQKVRTLLRADKAGHTGALDPLATGMLPICLGEATKIAGLLLGSRKAYQTRVQLGVETDTDDSEGVATDNFPVPTLTRERIEAVLPRFTGNIQQVPPRYSALKREGEPLYRRARRGEAFEVAARPVCIHAIHIVAVGEDWFDLDVECGSGTYIRSLARDLGRALQSGGHVTRLRRLWVEPFGAQSMHPLDALIECAHPSDEALNGIILPIEAGLAHWRQLRLDPDPMKRLRFGQRIPTKEPAGLVLVVDSTGVAQGLAEVDCEGTLHAKRLFVPGRGSMSGH